MLDPRSTLPLLADAVCPSRGAMTATLMTATLRDLAVSHFKPYEFAQAKGDEAMKRASLQACFTVLDAMKRRGLHMDPPIAQLHGQLAGMFGRD